MLFVSGASIVGNTILKGHMHWYEWSRDNDLGTAATRKSPLVNRRSRNRLLRISRGKRRVILCDFRFSSSFQEIDMILLTWPE